MGTAWSATKATMVVPYSVHNQIQPDTVYCVRGTDNSPVPYCADSTPCKTFTSPLGAARTVCLADAANPPQGATIMPSVCWDSRTEFTCLQYATDCSENVSNPACKEVGTGMCVEPASTNMPTGAYARVNGCLSKSRHFVCEEAAAVTQQPVILGCESTTTIDGLNWSSRTESAAEDFIQVSTSAEIARQLATYGDKDGGEMNNLFRGVPLGCRNKLFGLKNCCNEPSGGAASNAQMALATGVVMSGFKVGAGYAMKYGSQFVYDTIGPAVSGTFMQSGLDSMLNSSLKTAADWTSFTNSFGVMGFGFSASGAASGIGSTLGLYGPSSSVALGNSGVFFNPYAFAFAMGIQIVTSVMSCSEIERELATARKMQFCHYVGDYCSAPVKLFGVTIGCTETTSNYCCFNGLLGKAISEGAHMQLGLGWGSGESPNCQGLTMEQISAVDFTTPAMKAMLKPFQDEIMKGYKSKMEPALQNGSVTSEIKLKGDAAANKLCLQRQQLYPNTVCN